MHQGQYGAPAPAYAPTGVDPLRYAREFDSMVLAMLLFWQQQQAAAFAAMCFARTMMAVDAGYAQELVHAQQRQSVAYRMMNLLRGA